MSSIFFKEVFVGYIFKFCMLFFLLVISCEDANNNSNITEYPIEEAKTGKVTFVNESTYKLKVHLNSFSGPVVVEFLNNEFTKTVDVRVSDTHGFGTTFSIEYLYRISDVFDADSGEVLASGFDFNMQPNIVIEENKKYTLQIPNPSNLEFRSSFIKLYNAHNIPIELRDFGKILRQAGNNNIPISPGKTGIYILNDIPVGGEYVYKDYRVVSTIEETIIPDFTAKNAFIYSFIFNGNSVVQSGLPQSILFK